MRNIKYNTKKLFKGEEVYGFGKGEYSYVCTKAMAIRMKKVSFLYEEIKKDIIFSSWPSEEEKEKIIKIIFDRFELKEEKIPCHLSKLYILGFKNDIDIFLTDKNDNYTFINKNYIDIINSWGPWEKVCMLKDETGYFPVYFENSSGNFDALVMPFRDGVLPVEDVKILNDIVKSKEKNNDCN